MRKEIKTIVYDENLNVEVYRFEGINRFQITFMTTMLSD